MYTAIYLLYFQLLILLLYLRDQQGQVYFFSVLCLRKNATVFVTLGCKDFYKNVET